MDKGRDHLKAIVQHSIDVKFNTDQISAATREQSQAIQEIADTLLQLQKMADANANKAHDSNDIVHKLLGSAGKMEKTVEHLQVFLDGLDNLKGSARQKLDTDAKEGSSESNEVNHEKDEQDDHDEQTLHKVV